MKRRAFLRTAPVLGVALATGVYAGESASQTVSGRELRSLERAVEWINTPPLTANELRGKVVLIDFWTYTCMNWMRHAPYVRAWAEKYKDQGLVVIGVHTPEFPFEKELSNVRPMVKALNVTWPVAVDSDSAIWRGFRNNAWPTLYFIDAQGRVRHTYFGEGEYADSERMIQKLLAEAAKGRAISRDIVLVQGRGLEAPADWNSLKSPENYLGYERTVGFASAGLATDKRRTYAVPDKLRLNYWALAGDWTIGRDAIALQQSSGRIVYRFHARDVHVVMGPAVKGTPIRFRVLVDAQQPADAHGLDVDAQGLGTVKEQRLYQLIRQTKPVAERQLEIEFLDPGAEAFSFTFG